MAFIEYQLELMVQRVADFQRHQHAIWNSALSFDERVRDLPLYALEFNNFDRDSSKHGPTVAHYAPSRQEMIALSQIISENVEAKLQVLDVGCGNGFIGSLLAREGIPVIGIDNLSWALPQIHHLFDEQVYESRIPVSLEEYGDDFNVAFCSWMIPNANLTKQIVAKQPELIIHTYSAHTQPDESPQTGCEEAYRCPKDYWVLGAWATQTPANFFADVEPRFSRKSATIRITEIWCHRDIHTAKFFAPEHCNNEYSWDIEREFINMIRRTRNMDACQIRVIPD